MFGHDFLAGYSAKLLEYGLAVSYLVLFVAFWRYVQGGAKKAQPELRAAPHRERAASSGWFELPSDVALHPGHTWARLLADGSVAVGLDDLGHRMVGPVESFELPAAGVTLAQGEPAVRLHVGGKSVALVSPVDGEVIAYNAAVADSSDGSNEPYGQGWLFKVQPANWKLSRAQLLDGPAAKDWIEEEAKRLVARIAPRAGAELLQDGGVPVHGMAREIDPENWDRVASQFFHTEGA